MNAGHSFWKKRFVVHTVFLGVVTCVAATRYVALDGGHVPPFDSWATAATNIQDAVDASSDGDTVLVSNGVYATGGTWAGGWSNRVVIVVAIRVEGLGTASQTVIMGAGIRCLYLTSNAMVCNITLTNGWRAGDGGGVFIAGSDVLSNYIVSDNRTEDYGGGMLLERGGLVTACTLCGNVAEDYGGGAYLDEGGRVEHSWLAGNLAEDVADGSGGSVFVDTTGVVYACTLVTNRACYGAAAFLASNTAGSIRFINAGTNRPWMTGTTDLDGNPRVDGSCVEMGFYEFVPEPAELALLVLCRVYNLQVTM